MLDGLSDRCQAPVGQSLAVYENSGCSFNAVVSSLLQIPIDKVVDFLALSVDFKPRHFQTEVAGEFDDQFIGKFFVIFEQLCMQFPEFTLFTGSQSSSGSRSGEFVVIQGEVKLNDTDILGIGLEHLLEYGHQPHSVRSLIVAEERNHNRSVL